MRRSDKDAVPHVLPLAYVPKEEEFLAALKIKPGGLAAQMVQDLYHGIFTHSKELRREYARYYAVEYPTLQDYLETSRQIYLSEGDIKKKYLIEVEEWVGIVDPNYEDNQLDTILSCIWELEKRNEN